MEDIPLFIGKGLDTPHANLEFSKRKTIVAIVFDPKTNKYLCLRRKDIGWETFITGGIEKDQSAIEAALTEVAQETGYINLKIIKELSKYDLALYHTPKGKNLFVQARSFLFELIDYEQKFVEADELAQHNFFWLTEDELKDFKLPEGHRFLFNSIHNKTI